MKFNTSLTHAVAAFAISVSVTLFNAGTAAAKPVILITHDGYSRLSGDLLAYEDGVYHIKTTLGNLRVKASSVDCKGPGCPTSETVAKN